MDEISNLLKDVVPAAFDHLGFLKIFGLFCLAVLAISLAGRLLGKQSALKHALSAAIGIVCMYILAAAVFCLKPEFNFLLTSLPFLSVSGENLAVFPLLTAPLTATFAQILRMVILVFLVNVLESWLPQGKGLIAWYLLRFATVAAALVLQYGVFWLMDSYLPEAVITYAPGVFVALLVLSILIGALKLLIGLFLVTVNPLIGALYAFFFVNSAGKIVSKSVFSALLLTGIVYALNVMGYTLIAVTTSALMAFVPAVAALLVLWYAVRKLL